jgi:hypothetical protein
VVQQRRAIRRVRNEIAIIFEERAQFSQQFDVGRRDFRYGTKFPRTLDKPFIFFIIERYIRTGIALSTDQPPSTAR